MTGKPAGSPGSRAGHRFQLIEHAVIRKVGSTFRQHARVNRFGTLWAHGRTGAGLSLQRCLCFELPLLKDRSDKRIAPRVRVLGHAQIISRTGNTNCVVRDLSDTGAKLGVSSKVKLPAEFDLLFVRRRLTLRVRVRWRNGESVGVAFCEPDKAPRAGKPKDEQHVLDV